MNIREITKEITDKTMMSINSGLPIFIIVCYDHEADKLSLLESIKKKLEKKGITTCTFDPGGDKDHGIDKLYTRLASSSREKNLCIISGIPLNEKNKIQPDNTFIHYLNIHRDRIAKETIRMVLFLHASNAEDFINSAGDLWDFRHGTYWVEREKEKNINFLWEKLENRSNELENENSEDILRHIQKVKSLIDNTESHSDKARLLLDLAKWLRRRYANYSALESVYEALEYIRDKQDSLMAEIELEIGYCLHLNSDLPEALGHYQKSLEIRQEIGDTRGEGTTLNNISQIFKARGDYDTALSYLDKSLKIRQEIGDRAGEAVTCQNLAMEWERRKEIEKAIYYLKITVEIEGQTGHSGFSKDKQYLNELIQKQQS